MGKHWAEGMEVSKAVNVTFADSMFGKISNSTAQRRNERVTVREKPILATFSISHQEANTIVTCRPTEWGCPIWPYINVLSLYDM